MTAFEGRRPLKIGTTGSFLFQRPSMKVHLGDIFLVLIAGMREYPLAVVLTAGYRSSYRTGVLFPGRDPYPFGDPSPRSTSGAKRPGSKEAAPSKMERLGRLHRGDFASWPPACPRGADRRGPFLERDWFLEWRQPGKEIGPGMAGRAVRQRQHCRYLLTLPTVCPQD